MNRRYAGIVVLLYDNARRRLGLDKLAYSFQYLMNIDIMAERPARWPQHPVHQIAQAVGLPNNNTGVFF